MYLMISKYLVPLAEVDALREEHLAFVDALEAKRIVVAAGRQDPPVGGVILLNVTDEAQANEIIAEDPYVKAGAAEYTALGWLPTRGALKDY